MVKYSSSKAWLPDVKGFSLIEVMAAMAAGLVVIGAALQALIYFQPEFARQHEQMVQGQDIRLGLELFTQELRLAGSKSLSIARQDLIEFKANVSGMMTNVTAPVAVGQTTLAVEDGRGWTDNKLIHVCWNDQCEPFTLARDGQRNLLTLMEPVSRPIPTGAFITMMNRIRYYSRPDERGIIRWLRQVDGGASVIASNISHFALWYQDAQGHSTMDSDAVRSLRVEITVPGRTATETRQVSLRS